MDIFYNILFLIISYILGAIPFSFIIGKVFKKLDLRKYGSGNLGSTNAFRVLGKKLGSLVFILDVIKAMVILLLVKNGILQEIFNTTLIHSAFFGIMAVVGHCYSPFVKFKGGKAVACSLGVVLSLTPIPAILCLVVFGIVLKITGYVSLSSLMATLTVFISSLVQFLIQDFDWVVFPIYCFLSVLIVLRHRKNIKKLFNGTENSFKKKKDDFIKSEEEK